MTPEQIEIERVKFEAWCQAQLVRPILRRHPDYPADYEVESECSLWQGWKARAAKDYPEPKLGDDGRPLLTVRCPRCGVGNLIVNEVKAND